METWIEIKDFEGFYSVSNLGNVKSLDRILPDGRKIKSKSLKKITNKNGYQMVHLYKNSKRTHCYIHRLVAISFLKSSNKNCVNHINGNKSDNRVENLEWVTHSENNLHAKDLGLNKNRGTNSSKSKITSNQLSEIRNLLSEGKIPQNKIAEMYNVSKVTITDIKQGRRHKHSNNQ